MTIHTIEINMDTKCRRCGKGGATQNGYCLTCITKNISEGKYDHILKRNARKESNGNTR